MIVSDVIIVGAGPVGTVLAAELGRRNVSTTLLEMTDGVFRDPRLHAVSIRTMELVRKWGLTHELRTCGWPVEHPQDISFITSLSGHEIGRIPWPAIAKMQAPAESPTFAQRCPQSWFNPILHRYAQRFPSIQFRWHWRYDRFEQDTEGVTVYATNVQSGEREVFRSQYLVSCDGARSLVREHLGVSRESTSKYGHSAEAIIDSPDLANLARPRQAGRYTVVSSAGVSASLLPYDGKDWFRMTLMAEASQVDRARMDAAIAEVAGRRVSYRYITDVLPWVNRETSAERFRIGRVFIAGDAAHTMPPTGGHGMNTGVLDGFDLGWKLDGVIKGWAGNTLLDSYEFDRRKGAARTAAMAGEIYKDWIRIKPWLAEHCTKLAYNGVEGEQCRREVGEKLISTFRREFNSIGASIGYRYSGSPVIVSDGTSEILDDIVLLSQTACPGHRLPHAWISPGLSTLDLVGDDYTLIEFGTAGKITERFVSAARERQIPLATSHIVDQQIEGLFDGKAVIVRPDQHVAWRASGEKFDAGAVMDVLAGRVAPANGVIS